MSRIAILDLSGRDWRVRPYAPNEALFQRAWAADPNPALEHSARVPGDVVSDAIEAEGGAHPYYDRNSRLWEWTKDRDWLYRLDFDVPALDGRWARLEFDAVDYSCTAWLNGVEMGRHTGASDAFEFGATAALREGGNRLHVLVEAAPPEPAQIGRTSQVRTWKPRFAYGWDWTCRLVPLGIWGPVQLVLHEGAWLEDLWWRTALAADHAGADVLLLGTVRSESARRAGVVGEIAEPGGKVVARADAATLLVPGALEVSVPLRVYAPRLWWPRAYGEQHLYEATLTVTPEGAEPISKSVRLGIRDVRWTRTEGAPEDSLPYTPVVNGRRVYMMGYNWAPPDNLHGLGLGKSRKIAWLAAQSNANFIRVWGGAQLPPREFFDTCDEEGILVWQEFCQSSSGIDNEPPTDAAYIAMAEGEARGIVRKVRPHTCLTVWCGGNELMGDGWVPLGLDHPTLAALGRVVRELDPDRHYLPTSASGPLAGPDLNKLGQMHDVHGPWTYAGPVEHYRLWDGVDALLHSELGAPGAGNLETLRKWIPEGNLWPPDQTNPLWMYRGAWWITRSQTEELFGPFEELEPFIVASQYVQAEALRYAIEAARRRQWRCAGSIIWQFYETYPNASCTNSLDYDLAPKPSYVALRKAQAPLHASARYDSLIWHGKGEFEAGIYLSSIAPGVEGCLVKAELLTLDGAVRATEERNLDVPDPGTVLAFDFRCPIPAGEVFVLRVSSEHPMAPADNRVDVLLSAREAPIFGGLSELPRQPLEVVADADGQWVVNLGDALALPVAVTVYAPDGGRVPPADNLFALRPGERRRVTFEPDARVVVRGFNVSV